MHDSPSHVDRLQADSSYKPPQPDFAMEDSQDDMTGKKSPEQASSATAKGERLLQLHPRQLHEKSLLKKTNLSLIPKEMTAAFSMNLTLKKL